MADEQRIAKTNNMLFEGSQTEPRRQGAMATIVREAKTLPLEVGIPGVALAHSSVGTAAGLTALAAARRGYQFLAQRSDLARNNLLADYLSASGLSVSPVIDALNALGSARRVREARGLNGEPAH